MDENLLISFQQVIAGLTGLHFRQEDGGTLRQAILGRMKQLKLRRPEEYLALLAGHTAAGAQEWRVFIDLITTGESYFFRDKDQFALLRNRILPELMEKSGRQHSLRIWCAGCSTGEEPYSIAILLDQLLPLGDLRDVHILGTDISKEAIEKAGRGAYSRWSFRMTDPDLMRRYFVKDGDMWVVDERIRRAVTFQVGNLRGDPFPAPFTAIHDMDLIICRNVFIYFNKEAITIVLGKFINTLNEGGYLLTGHGELHGQELGPLRAGLLPESVIYRKVSEPVRARPEAVSHSANPEKREHRVPAEPKRRPPAATTKPVPWVPTGSTPQGEMETLFRKGNYAGVIETAEIIIGADPRNIAAYDLLARACANLGDYDKATRSCRKALEIDVTSIGPYLLLAHIAELRNDAEQAKVLLKKVVYLEPALVTPYLELAGIYEREEDHAHARKMRSTAAELLAALPSESVLNPYRETVGEMLENVKRMLRVMSEG